MKENYNNAVGPQVRGVVKRTSKIIPIMAASSVLAGVISATQYFAYRFQYQDVLGFNIEHFYPPWAIFQWWGQWSEIYPDNFKASGSIGALITTTGLLATALTKIISFNSSKPNEYLHGSARWANENDIKNAGLFSDTGVYVGAWLDKKDQLLYLRHSGPEHILTYAPTRSGKGVGLVLPTLLSYDGSTVILDLKGELWAMTAGWRKQHANNKVLKFDPAALKGSICWNPLDEIRVATEHEVGDVQNLATLIVDPHGKGLETHWQKTSQALLVGLIIHILYKSRNEGTNASLAAIDALLSDPSRNITDVWMEMTQYSHVKGKNHAVVGAAARDMLDRPEEEAGSVLSSTKIYLALFRDPVVAGNTSKSEFRIKDLMNHETPVSLYIVTQPNDKDRLRPLVRILINMIIRLLADKMEFERISVPDKQSIFGRLGWKNAGSNQKTTTRTKKTYKHKLLMMMDEFPSLGKLEIIQESLAFVAGYGIKFYIICQDINQLKSKEIGYGHDETITSNCHVQNAYPPNRTETAEYLSKLTGQTTIIKEQVTTSGKRASGILGQVSRTTQEVQRPLLTVDECLRMPGPQKDEEGWIKQGGDMVVYVSGFPAIYGRQPLYFQDPFFTACASVPAPAEGDKLRMADNNHKKVKLANVQ